VIGEHSLAQSNIMVVDDNPDDLKVLEDMLRQEGYEVRSFPRGRLALTAAMRNPPDLILLDINMPEMNGYEVCEHLKSTEEVSGIPVIFLSALDETEDKVKAFRTGAVDYISKPFQCEEIQARVETHLKVHALQLALKQQNEHLEETVAARTRELVRDITERKRAENALRASELKYRTLVLNIPQRILYKDRESVYVSCNDLYAQDLGIAADDIAGKTDFEFFPLELAEKYRADDRRIMELGRTVELEEDHVTKGNLHTVFTVKTPVVNEQGEVIGVLGVFTDITERKRVEESLRESERQLRLAQKLESIGQLAAGIAHEINTPVQYIGDNAQFLSGAFQDLFRVIERQTSAAADPAADVDVPYLRSEIPNAVAQIQEGVGRVATIVRAMKRFSHPGPAEKIPMNIHQGIESTILVSRNEWKYVADLTTDFDPEMPPIPCVAGEFNQVILNLIVNAAHAIADVVKEYGGKGAIRIGTRKNGDFAEIRVTDTGGGIPEAIRSKVFDPFFTTKAVGKGTGQGLAIAHSVIVQKHRGTIRFESEDRKGTTFVIQLPLEERTEEKQ
jgi:two-component system NtrC family sensor kinase